MPIATGTVSGDYAPGVAARSQKLMFEAGYEPKSDWVFITDLVEQYRKQFASSEDMLNELEEFLASAGPVTRASFKRFSSEARMHDHAREAKKRQRVRLVDICAQAGVTNPGADHEALALRIVELEQAVKSYAERLKAAELAAQQRSGSSFVPFVVGVAVGGALF
uniref:hypothetical protein n=1 Tax=Acidovorax sp. SUPP3334 TaxID=2920881 RepID=UPI002952947E|nr:hypothetical protein [Acidovorax sp. SUPP3334]BDH38379.1 hypothetical protein AVHM3334_23270 [Acidovorax sp. SUPP3334]